ncbi:hypothetical protein LEP1GSC050_2699 [Leptospira broomii serovar Hurstbridge str. 5399]|uniref:Lipoprotein n=2 Tax=Leptospira broomii TaxID=301541 RepID=T0F4L9_9LEPT|nr:hypothetical protein LEP1GSC050_2699 [Leptospira broomii serovar Hurstbridge str. 5399]
MGGDIPLACNILENRYMKSQSFFLKFPLFLCVLLGALFLVNCYNSSYSSKSTDPGYLLAVALAGGISPVGTGPCYSQSMLIKGTPKTATVMNPVGYYGMSNVMVLYFEYMGGGTTDSVTFSSSPSGSSGGMLNIAKPNVSVTPANVNTSSNFDAFNVQAPYSNGSVMTSSGSYRCYELIVPGGATVTYTISIM